VDLKKPSYFFKETTLIFLILLSSFGPYIYPSKGIRLEHIIIYSFLIIICLTNSIRIKKNSNLGFLLFTLVTIIIIPFFSYALLDKSISNNLAISQFENYFQPLSIFLICISTLHASNYYKIKECLDFVIKIFVIFMAIHTMFILIATQLFPDSLVLNFFTGQRVITELTWETSMNASELAQSAGRYSGVFTQVFEAGYAYALALISWAYLVNNNFPSMKYKYVALLLICIGGIMTYSKVFLVLGLLSFVVIIRNTLLLRYLSVFFLLGIVTSLFNLEIFSKGFIYLTRLIFIEEGYSVFDIYTSGRFVSDSNIWIGMWDVILNSPFYGYGYGSIQTSDFSLYEVISLGGLIGVLANLFLFFILFFINAKIKDRAIKRYYFYILLVTILSSLAAPVITANRVSVVFWILTSLIAMLNVTQFKKVNK